LPSRVREETNVVRLTRERDEMSPLAAFDGDSPLALLSCVASPLPSGQNPTLGTMGAIDNPLI
jgi:hypothetical protein